MGYCGAHIGVYRDIDDYIVMFRFPIIRGTIWGLEGNRDCNILVFVLGPPPIYGNHPFLLKLPFCAAVSMFQKKAS